MTEINLKLHQNRHPTINKESTYYKVQSYIGSTLVNYDCSHTLGKFLVFRALEIVSYDHEARLTTNLPFMA